MYQERDMRPFLDLVGRVAEIDIEAAQTMRDMMHLGVTSTGHVPALSGVLFSCFPWSQTDQPFDFWDRIDNLLGEE